MRWVRVVQASKAYWPHLGGIETVVRTLAEGVVGRGHSCTVIVADDGRTWPWRTQVEQVYGVAVKRAPSFGSVRSVKLAPTYPLTLLGERADVLHIHTPSVLPELTAAVLDGSVRKRFGRIVVSWHSDVVRQRLLNNLYEPAVERLLRMADDIVVATPNHVTCSAVLPRFAEKIRVVPFGIDPAMLELDEAGQRLADHYRERFGDRMVLFIGRLVYYKGVPELLEATAALDDAHVVMVGAGPLEEVVLGSQAARQGRLTLLAPVNEVEKAALLHACQVFVLPSTANSEAFGIVQVEAMACGKPVVTFDLSTGVTWVNQNGVTGLVAKRAASGSLAAAIHTLIEDRSRAAELGASARQRVIEQMTIARQIDLTLDIYVPHKSR
jgi:glycosyltransferase involved in cell wall biosynthesis